MRSPHRRLTVLSILVLALAPAQVRADVFAAVNVAAPTPRTDLDVAVVNASLGTRVALPSVVNTSAFEIHPSISSDGRRLLFQRFGGSDGIRLLLVDTSTGQSADLFTRAEIAANPIFNSNITADGRTVVTGRRFRPSTLTVGGVVRFLPEATSTNVQSFPTGPFSRTALLGPAFAATGSVISVARAADRSVFHVMQGTGLGQLLVVQPTEIVLLGSTRTDYGHPKFGGGGVYFEQRSFSPESNTFGDSGFAFGRLFPTFSTSQALGLNTPADESQLGFSPDGRYLGFVRHGADGRDRLFVRDLATQTTLNANGVDLGLVATRGIGSVSLYVRSVLTLSVISRTGSVNATLTAASNIGILVQRIVGTTKGAGRKHYELETVGRFPLGSYGAGNVFTHWDFEVDGEPLALGKYLVTVRAVEGDVVRELGKPQVLQIKQGRVVTLGSYQW